MEAEAEAPLSSLFCCLFRLISHEHPPCMHDYDLLLVLPSNQPLVESSFASALLAAAHICDISLINGPMHLKKEPQQFFLLRSLFSTQFSKSFHQNERCPGEMGGGESAASTLSGTVVVSFSRVEVLD